MRKKITEVDGNIEVDGHIGTWYVIGTEVIDSTKYFLLEHDEYGDEAACVIVDGDGKLILDDVYNGFGDLQEHFDSLDPVADTEQIPDADPQISIDDRNVYGYTANELLPLSKERAIDLWEQNLTVYLLYKDNTEAMVFDRADIDNHNGLFGIEKTDWVNLQKYKNSSL